MALRVLSDENQACSNCDNAFHKNGAAQPRAADIIIEDDSSAFGFGNVTTLSGVEVELRQFHSHCLEKPCPKGVLGT